LGTYKNAPQEDSLPPTDTVGHPPGGNHGSILEIPVNGTVVCLERRIYLIYST